MASRRQGTAAPYLLITLKDYLKRGKFTSTHHCSVPGYQTQVAGAGRQTIAAVETLVMGKSKTN